MLSTIKQGDIDLNETSSRNYFPVKCQECVKSSKPFVHGRCSFCQDLGFQEEVFCHLNRSIQNSASFECYAFQPLLKLVEPSGQQVPTQPKVKSRQSGFKKLLNSDKVKYQWALALQKIACDPDDVLLEIKYHFAWNVICRRPVFAEPGNAIDFISDTFANCSEAVGGFASLLWLAPDHIHLYVESDGEESPDSIAQKIKRLSAASILEQFPDLIVSSDVETELWDKTYFVETIG